ncbi:MAG: hypothetical protein COA43_13300 [Robiginitomaculum sp.]|nr:MAG: hypothetical protein COA43_13300 [Robiginitomaculum sp.]
MKLKNVFFIGVFIVVFLSYFAFQPVYLNIQSYYEVKNGEQSAKVNWAISTRTGERKISSNSFLDEINVGYPYSIRVFIETRNTIDEELIELEIRSLEDDIIVMVLKPDVIKYRNHDNPTYTVKFSNINLPTKDIVLKLTGIEHAKGRQNNFSYKSLFKVNVVRKIISYTLFRFSSV